MDNDDIDRHPDLRGLRESRGFGLRARWQARRNRARLVRQWRSPDVSRQQRRRTAALIAGIVVAAIGAVAVATYWNDLTGQSSAQEPATRTLPSTTATKYVPDAAVDLREPFVGTPAANWRNGMAGIKMPNPNAMGSFSAAETRAAIKAVRQSLRAAYLDRRVIEGHDLDLFLRTLAPYNQRAVRKDYKQGSTYAVKIHRNYPLLPASPKAHGKITMRAGRPGELIFDARFAVAYAFDAEDRDRLLGAMDIVSVVKSEVEYRFYAGPGWNPDSLGVQIISWEGYTFSMNCGAAKKGLLAPTYSDPNRANGPPGHDTEYYFDPTKPIAGEGNCRA